MKSIISALLAFLSTMLRSRLALQLEIVALRHQLTVYQRTAQRPRNNPGDPVLWSWLARRWSGWRDALILVQPGTVIAWERKRFRDHWARLSKPRRPGRPPASIEIKALIRKMSEANVGWGSPRIIGELRKLGIDVAKSTVQKYRVRSRKPPSPTWKAYLNNHAPDMVSIDFFVVLNDRHLKRILTSYLKYYHRWRTHLSPDMDGPESRSLQLPALGNVIQFPEAGGLHHHYERLAA